MEERRRRKTEQIESRRKTSHIIEIEEAQKRRKAKRDEYVKQEKVQKRVRKKTSRPRMSRGKKFAVCGVIALVVLVFVSSGLRIIELNLNKSIYETRYEERLAEKARLEKELSSVDDIEYIGQQARDRFNMLREGEILYVFPENTLEAQ